MIFVPNYENFSCVYVVDKDTIRVLNPTNDIYTDYYVNSHYMSKNGVLESSYDWEIHSPS